MASLLVHGIDDDLARALARRAAAHGRTPEEEHREILRKALSRPSRRALEMALAELPRQREEVELYVRGG
jgi:plasmid stability protein